MGVTRFHCPAALTRRKNRSTLLNRKLNRPQGGSERFGEEAISCLCRNSSPEPFHPVGSRYTDYAIPALGKMGSHKRSVRASRVSEFGASRSNDQSSCVHLIRNNQLCFAVSRQHFAMKIQI